MVFIDADGEYAHFGNNSSASARVGAMTSIELLHRCVSERKNEEGHTAVHVAPSHDFCLCCYRPRLASRSSYHGELFHADGKPEPQFLLQRSGFNALRLFLRGLGHYTSESPALFSGLTLRASRSKAYMQHALALGLAGVRVAPFVVLDDSANVEKVQAQIAAAIASSRIRFPVAVKVADRAISGKGRNVHLALSTIQAIIRVLNASRGQALETGSGDRVSAGARVSYYVEQMVQRRAHYRFMTVDHGDGVGKVWECTGAASPPSSATAGAPSPVTVARLIERQNTIGNLRDHAFKHRMIPDADLLAAHASRVPAAGERVILSLKANFHQGAAFRQLRPSQYHPGYNELAKLLHAPRGNQSLLLPGRLGLFSNRCAPRARTSGRFPHATFISSSPYSSFDRPRRQGELPRARASMGATRLTWRDSEPKHRI